MKKILFIATGGTIASKKTENGLTPQITPEELLSYIPEVEGLCEITAVNPFNLDSSNVVPENWSTLVKVVKEHYEDYDGFVIAHGTDTMAYTAAALSYMIQNSEKPIVITGAQRPINLDITDAKTNLSDSFYYACDDASQGVQIVFDGKVIAGTRAKKVRTKSYNAFSSIDFPYLAVIQDRRILRYLPMLPYEKPVRFYENLSDNVFLLKLIPESARYCFRRFLSTTMRSLWRASVSAVFRRASRSRFTSSARSTRKNSSSCVPRFLTREAI